MDDIEKMVTEQIKQIVIDNANAHAELQRDIHALKVEIARIETRHGFEHPDDVGSGGIWRRPIIWGGGGASGGFALSEIIRRIFGGGS